jgi:hypothetical protein
MVKHLSAADATAIADYFAAIVVEAAAFIEAVVFIEAVFIEVFGAALRFHCLLDC